MSALRAPESASPPQNMHRALIFNGTSRYHGTGSVKLTPPGGGGMAAAPNARPRDNGVIVIGPGGNNLPAANPPKGAVAAAPKAPAAPPVAKPAGELNLTQVAAQATKPQLGDPKVDVEALAKDMDAHKPEATVTEIVKKAEPTPAAVAPGIKPEEADEPLLQENPQRFVLFPIKYHEVRVTSRRDASDALIDLGIG